MKQSKGKVSIGKNVRRIFIILFWLLLWHLLSVWVDNAILLVTPMQALEALLGLLFEENFWKTIVMSLCRIGTGFLLGTVLAWILAACSNRFVIVEEILAPVMTLCKAVPVAVFVVLLLIWWGSSFLAVAVCFLIVLPNIYISTLEGIKNTDRKLLEMAEVFELPTKTCFFYIYRPALKSFLHSSLKLSLGMCWKSGVAAEVIGTPEFSIGEQLYMSKIYLNTADVFAWAAVIILLSMAFEYVILAALEIFWNWEPKCRCTQSKEKTDSCDREIRLTDVSKAFGDNRVLAHCNVVYQSGQTYYLTSPSGSGKTTLLRILCGLEQQDSGRIESGEICYSMVFQEDRLCEDYSAIRNVEMVTGDREKAAKALLQLLEEEALNKPCSQLSGGMKRRVALVRAMESASDCVLLDEPFTGMDADTARKAEAYIQKRQQGRICIIAKHI